MERDNNTEAFLSLVRAGLWEKEVTLRDFGFLDFAEIMRLSEEQSVAGVVAAGLEHITDVKVPQEWTLQFVGIALQIEQRNKAMNAFVARLIETLGNAGINTLLIKGQGIAQCYEKSLWRVSGDVDLYLSTDNYERAKAYLSPKAQRVEAEDKKRLHLGMTIEGWLVELHGTMHTSLSRRMNRMSDEVHDNIFFHGNVRGWNNNGVQVSLPAPDEDVIIIFNHFISHFYLEGVGLRQICDWCRLLYAYKESLDYRLLESRVKRMRLMAEWKAFAVIAVEYLGMPEEAMPMYDARFKAKGEKVLDYVMKSGNFGHNKDNSYRGRYSEGIVNIITFFRRMNDFMKLSLIFPQNSPRFFLSYMLGRVKARV